MARRKPQQQYPWEQIEGATGASDATSGGGAGAGLPDAETVERTGGVVLRGDVARDKKRLFPERFGKSSAGKSKSKKGLSSSASRRGSTSGRAGGSAKAKGSKAAARSGGAGKSRRAPARKR